MVSRTPKAYQYKISRTNEAYKAQPSATAFLMADSRQQNACWNKTPQCLYLFWRNPRVEGGKRSGKVSQTTKAHQYNISRTNEVHGAQPSEIAYFTADSRQQNASWKKPRNICTCFEVIPGQRGKRSVGWLAGPQTLISTIFHGRGTCMSLSVRQWPGLRLIQDSKTSLGMKNRNIAACFQFIPGQRGE